MSTSAALVWFTFNLDEGCLLQSVRAARHHAPECPRAVIVDSAAPLSAAGMETLTAAGTVCSLSTRTRSGNLNGLEWLDEQLHWLAQSGQAMDWVIKIDSDTLLNARPENWLQFAAAGHAAVCAWQPKWWFQGPCYALRSALPQALRDHIAAGPPDLSGGPECLSTLAPKYPEDAAIGHLTADLHGPAAILALPGGSSETLFNGTQIAHYNFRSWPAFDLYRPFQTVSFGNRRALPPQMPDSVQRHTVANVMEAFLDDLNVPD